MNLCNAIRLENLSELQIRDLAIALMAGPNEVDWDSVHDACIHEFGSTCALIIVRAAMESFGLSESVRKKILSFVVNAGDTAKVEVHREFHPRKNIPYEIRCPDDDAHSVVVGVVIHDIALDASDLTAEGIQAAQQWAACPRHRRLEREFYSLPQAESELDQILRGI